MNNNKLSEPGDYYLEREGEVLPPEPNNDTPLNDAKSRGETVARAYMEKNDELTREVFPSDDMDKAYRVSRRLLELDDHDYYSKIETTTSNTPEIEIKDPETIEKGQKSKEKWYTDKQTKERKKYTISVAYVIRTRGEKNLYLESSRRIPESGASNFLIVEWEELEKRIDKGEGREI